MGNNEKHIRELIVYLVANQRYMILYLLNDNSIIIKQPRQDKQIVEAVYEGIGKSNRFRQALKSLMVNLATGGNSTTKKTIDDFVRSGAVIQGGFVGVVNDGGHTENAGNENQVGDNVATQESKSSFQNTQVGGFLSTLFTKENINKYIDTGITLAKNKQAIKANQQNIDIAAMQLEQQKLGTPQPVEQRKNNWVLPVVVGSVILIGIIVTVVIVKNKKA